MKTMERNNEKSNRSQERTPRVVVPKKDHFATTKTKPNYKDVLVLRRFLTDKFKIQPVSRTGLSAKNQRLLAAEIKKARFMGLLPYTDLHSQL